MLRHMPGAVLANHLWTGWEVMSIAVQHASGSLGRAIYGWLEVMSIAVQYAPGVILTAIYERLEL